MFGCMRNAYALYSAAPFVAVQEMFPWIIVMLCWYEELM